MAPIKVDGIQNNLIYNKDISIGQNQTSKIYFSTYQTFDKNSDGTINFDSLKTYQMIQKGNDWYTSAELGDDGTWIPLNESNGFKYSKNLGSGQSGAGTLTPIGGSASEFVAGEGVRNALSQQRVPGNLSYEAVNNSKYALKDFAESPITPGGAGVQLTRPTTQQLNDKFNERHGVTGTGGGGSQSPDQTDSAPPLDREVLAASIKGKGRKNYELNLRYPEDLSQFQDKIKISVLEYSGRSLSTGTDQFGFGSRKERNAIGAVTLAVPGNINDSNRVDWGGQTLNALQLAAADVAYDFILKGGQAAAESAEEGLNKLRGALGEGKKGLASFFAKEATGASGILARTEGAILNPNLELLFQNPTLRPFTFNFRMSPRSVSESTMIMKIIRMFKQSMAVQRSQSNLFLKAPNTYKLEFFSSEETPHKFLPKIKECALVSFTVNYTPDGTYSTFYNSSMAAYELSFEFQELEPIFNDEYGDEDNTGIGY